MIRMPNYLPMLAVLSLGVVALNGLATGYKTCFDGAEIFPREDAILRRAVSNIPESVLKTFAQKIAIDQKSGKAVTPFQTGEEYLRTFPDCCQLSAEETLPQNWLRNAAYQIGPPNFWDGFFRRGSYVLALRYAGHVEDEGNNALVVSDAISLHWISACGAIVPVPKSKQVG